MYALIPIITYSIFWDKHHFCKKKWLKTLGNYWTQYLQNLTISEKLRIAQKKIIQAKHERQINCNLPCKFCNFWRKLNFWAPNTPLLDVHGAQTQYDVICNLRPFLFSAHCASFISRWLLLRGGVCISLVGSKLSCRNFCISLKCF